jgi:hypothetical protein
MTRDEYLSFARGAAHRAIAVDGRIGCLVFTQVESGQPKLREPELQFAFGIEAGALGLLYGVEVPTQELYRFTREEGLGRRRGCMDFVILDAASPDAERLVLTEFKEGQPSTLTDERGTYCPAISKDLHKLLREPAASGKSMVHICHAANTGTIRAVLAKYDAGLKRAVENVRAEQTPGAESPWEADTCWFEFLLLIAHQRGKIGGDRPCLYRLAFTNLCEAVRKVLAGEGVFEEARLVPVPLTAGSGKGATAP